MAKSTRKRRDALNDMLDDLRLKSRRVLAKLSVMLGVDITYFIRGGLWLSIPQFVNYALGFVRSIFFARYTPQAIYGQFSFVNSVANTLVPLTLPGIKTALTETTARGNTGSLPLAAKTRAKWSLLSTLATIFVAIYYFLAQERDLALALILLSALTPWLSAGQVVQAYFSGQKRFDMVSWINILQAILNTIAIIVVIFLRKDIVWLVGVNYGTQLLLNLFYYYREARKVRNEPVDPLLVKYGKAFTWAEAIQAVAIGLDSVILGFTAGFVDVAIYQIATLIPRNLNSLLKTLTPISMPKIAENPDKLIYSKNTKRLLGILLGVNFAIILVSMLLIPVVLLLLYGTAYSASIGLAQLLMLSLAFSLPGYFFTAALQARKRTRPLYTANLIYGIMQIVLLLSLAPRFGAYGIVASRILSNWVTIIYAWAQVRKI